MCIFVTQMTGDTTTTVPALAVAAAPRPMREGLARVAWWAPVWIPMVLFAHVAWRGLRPALSEAERLDDAAAVLDVREEAARSESALVKAHLDARHDDIYLERQRRLRSQYRPQDLDLQDGEQDLRAGLAAAPGAAH